MCKSIEQAARHYCACKYALMREMDAAGVSSIAFEFKGEQVKITFASDPKYTVYNMDGASPEKLETLETLEKAYKAAEKAYKAERAQYAQTAHKKPYLSDTAIYKRTA